MMEMALKTLLIVSVMIYEVSMTTVVIYTQTAVHTVEPFYVSYCVDAYLLGTTPRWLNFDFTSKKLRLLMSAFGPAILRFGGSPADWTEFSTLESQDLLNKTGINPPITAFTKEDLDNMVNLTRSTGTRLLFDLDLQLRYGSQWDPSNTMEMMQYMKLKGYGDNIDFELGNEPAYYNAEGQTHIKPERVAEDFLSLTRLVKTFPNLQYSKVVGPDVGQLTKNSLGYHITKEVADKAGGSLTAITFHQYYFRGDTAHVKDYLDPSKYKSLEGTINTVKNLVQSTSHPDLPLYIGETSDSWHSGTENVTDRFVSGFLYLEKLGLAAQMGVSVVMRQTLYGHNYGLLDNDLNPNPDYWLGLIHKTLVGTKVLNVAYVTSTPTTRVYAHCTNLKRTNYTEGSITVFALNVNDSMLDTIYMFPSLSEVGDQPADAFILEAPLGDKDGILSKYVAVNGQVLKLIDESTMPTLNPKKASATDGLPVPPLSMAFYVLPQANVSACMS